MKTPRWRVRMIMKLPASDRLRIALYTTLVHWPDRVHMRWLQYRIEQNLRQSAVSPPSGDRE